MNVQNILKGTLIVLVVSTLSCKTKENRHRQMSEETEAPPPDAKLFLAPSHILMCSGNSQWPSDLFDKFVINEGLSSEDWQMQKLVMQKALSSLPPQMGVQMLAHGGSIHLVKNAYEACKLQQFKIPQNNPVSFCMTETDSTFTIYLSSYENTLPSIKPASMDAVYAVMNAFVHKVMSNQLSDEGLLPRLDDKITNYNQVVEKLYNDLVKLGLTLPIETQEDVFVALAYMSLCSQSTQEQLNALLSDAAPSIYSLIAQVFKDDYSNSKLIQNLASTLPNNGLALEGGKSGILVDMLSSVTGVEAKKAPLSRFEPDQAIQISEQRFRSAVNDHPELSKAERDAAIADVERSKKPPLSDLLFYEPALEKIRNKPAFRAVYRAEELDQRTGCFLQVAKDTSSVPYATEVSRSTQRITLTVHGTFDSMESKVGGTWADPIGTTAMGYAQHTHGNKQALGQEDYLAAFRWGGANTKASRSEGATHLATILLSMAEKRKPISPSQPLEISLVGHSHGGNVSFEALQEIEKRALAGDPKALAFLSLVQKKAIKVRTLAIATPKREDYLPPRWAGAAHGATANDGVAFLGMADSATDQFKRFATYPITGDAIHDKAWRQALVNDNLQTISVDAHGLAEVFGKNHIDAPGIFLEHLDNGTITLSNSFFSPTQASNSLLHRSLGK